MTLTTGPCNRCGRQTVAGLTNGGRVLAIDVTVDSRPLDPLGELACLVAGCDTWTLHTVARTLHARTAIAIRTRPAGTRHHQTVHATHICPGRMRT